MLSLVTESLVIVNKENVIDFTGSIIINWRSLFSKSDYIHILNYKGFVTEIRFIHFRIYETIEHGDKRTTGKLIKTPNSIVITNLISTFISDDSIISMMTSLKVP